MPTPQQLKEEAPAPPEDKMPLEIRTLVGPPLLALGTLLTVTSENYSVHSYIGCARPRKPPAPHHALGT